MSAQTLSIGLVFIAAFASGVWNIHVKKATNRLVFVSLMVVPQFFISLFLAFLSPLPSALSFVYLITSSLVQTSYIIFLGMAYQHGLISRVYPIAVGTASLISLIFWHIHLKEALSILQEWGVILLSFGIISFAFIGKNTREFLSLKGIIYALITSFFIFTYSLIDTFGIRICPNSLSYISWLFLIKALVLFLPMLAFHKISMQAMAQENKDYIVAGLLAGFSYGAAMWAFSLSATPIILALRSTSILFVFFLSVFYLKEKISPRIIALTLLVALSVFLILGG